MHMFACLVYLFYYLGMEIQQGSIHRIEILIEVFILHYVQSKIERDINTIENRS